MPENAPHHKMDIEQRLHKVIERVRAAELAYGREPGSVQILPVSKTRPVEDILSVVSLGLPGVGDAFAESYLQEAQAKIAQLGHLSLTWHFIGPIQSNKTAAIARLFQWVHSVDRLRVARRLSEQRPPELGPLNVCLQVNISNEVSKSGVGYLDLPELVQQVAELPGLRLRGLMAIPAAETDWHKQRAAFATLREAFEFTKATQNRLDEDWDTLSMGMSADLEAAIAEGATIVRIGSALFGPRMSQPGH